MYVCVHIDTSLAFVSEQEEYLHLLVSQGPAMGLVCVYREPRERRAVDTHWREYRKTRKLSPCACFSVSPMPCAYRTSNTDSMHAVQQKQALLKNKKIIIEKRSLCACVPVYVQIFTSNLLWFCREIYYENFWPWSVCSFKYLYSETSGNNLWII